MLERLVDPPPDENGLRVGRDLAFDRSHRHFSHLFAIWPLRIHNIDHPECRELSDRSIARWLSLDEELQGYTWTSSSCMAAGFGDGDAALVRLNNLRPFLQPNTMYTENGPVIETPISAAESTHDMILQSWTDPLADGMKSVIRVFPAVPTTWSDVAFRDLRAEGGFLVSAARKNGSTQWIEIESLAGEPCVLQTDIPGELTASNGVAIEQVREGRWSIALGKGGSVVLHAVGATPDLEIAPVERTDSVANIFGAATAEFGTHSGKMARDPEA